MSLNRVASVDTLAAIPHHDVSSSRDRRSSDASLRVRRLSFNPVPQDLDSAIMMPDDPYVETVGAFEVPQWKRLRKLSPFGYWLHWLHWRHWRHDGGKVCCTQAQRGAVMTPFFAAPPPS
ncbi:hypothetical protein B0T10DRAFT_477102, partial [Thelonectria olida]